MHKTVHKIQYNVNHKQRRQTRTTMITLNNNVYPNTKQLLKLSTIVLTGTHVSWCIALLNSMGEKSHVYLMSKTCYQYDLWTGVSFRIKD